MPKLKMQNEHIATIQTYISHVLLQHPEGWKTYKDNGASHKRYRWDLFTYAKVEGNTTEFIINKLYPSGLHDIHIDSALKHIVGSNWPE